MSYEQEIDALLRENDELSMTIDQLKVENERLREEVEAWRRSFPTQHIRPGDAYCCTKLESYEQ